MKKMDTQVHGSEHNGINQNYLKLMSDSVVDFTDEVSRQYVIKNRGCREELSSVLFMLVSCRRRLLKLKSTIQRRIDNDIVINLVKILNKIIISKCFEGIYVHEGIAELQMLVMKNTFLAKIRKKYHLCINNIKNCCHTFGALSDIRDIIWTNDEVLIGTLRNREQLEIILKNNFYHIPEIMIPDDKNNFSYIAIYQSKNLFGKEAGIKYFGKIVSSERVKRKDITQIPSDSDDIYLKFYVDTWNNLGSLITPGHGGMLVGFTNLYMLLRANVMDELYFKCEQEFKLYRSIKTSVQKGYDKVATTYNGCVIAINGGNISVYKDRRMMYNITVRDYMKNQVSVFNSIIKICKRELKCNDTLVQ